jgi:hypothetical protein
MNEPDSGIILECKNIEITDYKKEDYDKLQPYNALSKEQVMKIMDEDLKDMLEQYKNFIQLKLYYLNLLIRYRIKTILK